MALALAAAEQVRPLDPVGEPADNGRIVVVSVGMSNTSQEFSRLVELAANNERRAPHVVLLDGAQNGRAGRDWPHADEFFDAPRNAP